jgi:hypothetical protein
MLGCGSEYNNWWGNAVFYAALPHQRIAYASENVGHLMVFVSCKKSRDEIKLVANAGCSIKQYRSLVDLEDESAKASSVIIVVED